MSGVRIALLVVVLINISLVSAGLIRAVSVADVNTTVKISVCGDGIVENPEECDLVIPDHVSCTSQGYAGGVIQCDVACELDLSGCYQVTRSETDQVNEVGGDDFGEENESETLNNLLLKTREVIESLGIELPAQIRLLDPNLDNFIATSEVEQVVIAWVSKWEVAINAILEGDGLNREKEAENIVIISECDLNRDGLCDLRDVSVLFYYVGK